MNVKHNIPLLAGLAIPVLMVALIAISIYLPRTNLAPRYNFVYATGGYPTYYERQEDRIVEHVFRVENQKLIEETAAFPAAEPRPVAPAKPTFFIHDTAANTSREAAVAEVQQLTIDSSAKSPDGLEVVPGTAEGGVFPFVFFGGRDYNRYYLTGQNTSQELDVRIGSAEYYPRFQFIGWITE